MSLTGLGSLLNLMLFPSVRIDWGLKAALGLSLAVAIGGFLNIVSAISPSTIIIILFVGSILFLVTTAGEILGYHKEKVAIIDRILHDGYGNLVISLFLIASIFVCMGWSVSGLFNIHDDFQAYFVFPQKMLQTGSLGNDPFSERRIISGLGGQSFLQTLVLAFLPENNLNLLEPGIAMVILAGLVIAEVRRSALELPQTILIFMLVIFVALPKANITSLGTGIVLFIAYYRILAMYTSELKSSFARCFMPALIISSLCSLKSSFIPPVSIMLLLFFLPLLRDSTQRKRKIKELLLVMVITIVLISPWMLSLYRSSGTFLYPLLGRGFHGSRYGTFLSPTSGLSLSAIPILLLKYTVGNPLLLIEIILFILFRVMDSHLPTGKRSLLSMAAGTILGAELLIIALGGLSTSRFIFPFVYPAVILLFIALLRHLNQGGGRIFPSYFSVIPLCCLGILVGNDYLHSFKIVRELTHDMADSHGSTFSREKIRYLAMQQSIPRGETILARLEKPFSLDFNRNTVFIVDYPGGQSPPPGLPFFSGGEAVAAYLKGKSIRYVAYSYANEAGFSKKTKEYADRLLLTKHPWERTEALHTFDFQDNLMELAKTRKRIYDDGDIFVLDLFTFAKG